MAVSFNFNNTKIQIFKIFSGTLDEIIQMHAHSKNGYEIHLIDYGNGILETENEKYNISKNTLYVTGPNVLHKQTPDMKEPMHELCIFLKVQQNSNKDRLINSFTSKNFWIGKSNVQIRGLFKQMIAENEKNGLWQDEVLSSLTLRLIVEITRLYFPSTMEYLPQIKETDLYENRSWILEQLLLDDLSNTELNDFAIKLGVCPRQAERIIKEHCGSSFKKLKYESKMAMAATLLERKDFSVEECAAKCGYSTSSAFISAFKKKYRTTPKKYRERI